MTVAVPDLEARRRPLFGTLPLALSLALREQRNGLKGFYVFIACVALGVAVITGVGALADALRSSFERQGEVLLGGDVTLSRPHQPAKGEQRDWLWKQGRISEAATMRAMARQPNGTEQALVELKGVDAAYPLVGAVRLVGDMSLDDAIRHQPAAVIDPILLERLALKVGDRISLGKIEVPISATIAAEPDKLTERLTVGPRVLVSLETMQATGLIDPGSLVSWRYALKLGGAAGQSDNGLVSFRERIKQGLPEGGFTVRDRRDPSPQVSRTLERLRQFLTLVGLTALLVGGVGVANAVATYIDRRRKIIAAFKSLGATSRTILWTHLLQVMMIALIGIVARHRAGFSHSHNAVGHGRRCPADQGRSHGQRAQLADRGGLRAAGIAAVCAVAAGTGRAGARRRSVPRRGGAGARSAALAYRCPDAGCCLALGGARGFHVRGAQSRPLLLRSAWSACSPYFLRSAAPSPGRPGASPDPAGPSWRWPSATSVHRED